MTKEEAFAKFIEIYEFAEIEKKLEEIVDVEKFKLTPCAPSLDSGVAYEGAIMYETIMMWHFANKLMPIYNKITPINEKSLAKVIVLHQLGKVDMFIPNPDKWQVDKLGKVYGFTETNYVLKTGERSKLLCGNAGIQFTPEEYEAMSILDKTPEEYENSSKFISHLSTIFKMCVDLTYICARERLKKK